MSPSPYLLQLSLGPVQGFIATARRSRDLWFGSYVLSEISKAAALSLCNSHARLIFPNPPKGEADLTPGSPLLVVNIVTAEVDAHGLEAAKTVLETAHTAAKARWDCLCTEARDAIAKDNASISPGRAVTPFLRDDVWRAQLSDVVEVFRAAVPLDGGYAKANAALRLLMANRKNTRDFTPYADTFALPKSSLDGAQSTVIQEGVSERARRRLGVEPAEQLDTAGMVKRVVGRKRGFVPVARAAAAHWLEQVATKPADLAVLVKAYQALVPHDFATKLDAEHGRKRYEEYGWIKPFPFDAELLYAERIDAELARRDWARLKASGKVDDDLALTDAITCLRDVLVKLKKDYGEPPAYYGLLLADGDRMGRLIDVASSRGADAHRKVSAALSAFAQAVPDLMSRSGGACIYSGGDDVLGLVSLPKALRCAAELAKAFRAALCQVAQEYEVAEAEWPTLSVGIAVAHAFEPLGDVRVQAGEAERLAKGAGLPEERQRNALAMRIKPRGGNALEFRIRWDEPDRSQMLSKWLVEFTAGRLPRGLPHELHAQWQRCSSVYAPGEKDKADSFAALWRAMVTTMLARKRDSGDGELLDPTRVQELITELCDRPEGDVGRGNALLRDRLDLMRAALWLSGRAEPAST